MAVHDRQISKEDIVKLRKMYPDLEFSMSRRTDISHQKNPEYSIAEVRGFRNSPNTVLRFREQEAFSFLANNCSDFMDITILQPNAALLKDNLLFGILDYTEDIKGMFSLKSYDFSLKSELVSEEFILKHDDVELKVSLGGLGERLDKAWKFIDKDSTKTKFISRVMKESDLYFSRMNENELSQTWDFLIYSLYLGLADNRFAGLDLLGHSFIAFLPRLTKVANNFLIIEPIEGGNNSFRDVLETDHHHIINSIFFSYYYTQRVLPKMVDLKSEYQESPIRDLLKSTTRESKMDRDVYRYFNQETLQYIAVAENSSTPSFCFLSFYHILESYFDDAQYHTLKQQIGKILWSPDIGKQSEKYASKIVEMLISHKPAYETDQDRLQKLLESYLPITLIPDIIPKEIQSLLKKRVKFEGGLVLDPVNFKDSTRFFGDLARRVYLLRNAIVHSKRLVDERKGRIVHTPGDYERISRENELIRYLAMEILSRAGLRKME